MRLITPESKQAEELTAAHNLYTTALHSRVHYKIQDIATGDDLVQITFLKTWTYLVRGGKIHLMKAFLFHVLNGLIIDEYRKNKPDSLDLLIKAGFEPSLDESESLFNVADGHTALRMIKKLPSKYREIMEMRYVRGLSLSEISTLTGRTKNTIAVQAHRGLNRLKILYGVPM